MVVLVDVGKDKITVLSALEPLVEVVLLSYHTQLYSSLPQPPVKIRITNSGHTNGMQFFARNYLFSRANSNIKALQKIFSVHIKAHTNENISGDCVRTEVNGMQIYKFLSTGSFTL